MRIVPLAATPAQTLNIVLGGQNCQVTVSQKSTGVFFDLVANNVTLTTSRIGRDAVPLVNNPSSGFIGDFMFCDTRGGDDPYYTGFGSRWFLTYLEAADLL